MAGGDKTEQATPRRRQKAREQGQVTRSRELAGALAGFAALIVALWTSSGQMQFWRTALRQWTELAAGSDFSVATPAPLWVATTALRWMVPGLLAAWMVAVLVSVAQGGVVFAPESLLPKPGRLSPAQKLGQMFSLAGLSAPAKSLLPFAVLLYLGTAVLVRDWELLERSSLMPAPVLGQFFFARAFEIAWKSTLTLLLWAGVDYLLQWQKSERDLRMSKQEVRDEYKETEGHPGIKARIRRLQRQARRRRMLQDAQKATVVITNPTHLAVALEYRPEMEAPTVLAKGANALAEEIKRIAVWHEVPLVENRPLAQALYRTVEVGQSIPAKLYTAVAEILAFVYRAQSTAQRAGPSPAAEGRG